MPGSGTELANHPRAEVSTSPLSSVDLNRLETLVEAAERITEHPAAALRAVIDLAIRALSRRSGPGREAKEDRAARDGRESSADIRPEESTPASPAIPAGPKRPFLGFDRERELYRRRKPDLLLRDEGRYVVIVGEELMGPFDTSRQAEREGFARFGLGPLYIRRILAKEPEPIYVRTYA